MVAFIYDQLVKQAFFGFQNSLGNGGINIYSDPQPALNSNVALNGFLVMLLFGSPVFNTATASNSIGTAAASVLTPGVVQNSGSAKSFIMFNGFGQRLVTGTVGAPASGADLILDKVNLVAGKIISIQSLNVNLPET